MSHRALARPLTLDGGGKPRTPPSEFKIWSFGKVQTVKGTFLFDQKAASNVMQAWKDWGNRLTFDYEHGAVSGTEPGHGKSAGSCLLELREDGLWATDVKWTPRASSELSNAEWLYFSPAFISDAKTGRILQLINIALTNVPATKGMTPLVAASRVERTTMKTLQKLLAASLAAFTEYGAARIELDDVEADADGDTDEMKAAKAAKIKAAKSRLAKAKLEYEAASREAAAFGDSDADGDNDGDEPPAAKPAKSDETDELDEDTAAKDPKMCARVTAIASRLVGKKTGPEILGALQALTATRGESSTVLSLKRTVEKLSADLRSERIDKKLVVASKAGKLTPKLREQAIKIGMRGDETELDAFLDALPTSVRTPENRKVPDASVVISPTTLSKSEREMCERMCPPGIEVEVWTKSYLAQKSKNAARLATLREDTAASDDIDA